MVYTGISDPRAISKEGDYWDICEYPALHDAKLVSKGLSQISAALAVKKCPETLSSPTPDTVTLLWLCQYSRRNSFCNYTDKIISLTGLKRLPNPFHK